MSLVNFLKNSREARKVFGERELKIIEKQLWGMQLTQSEKNRLSRDIRKKLNFIKEIVQETKEIILEHKWFRKIKEICLFGSIINREHNLSSDIDIAVVFDEINEKEAFEFRKEVLGKLSSKIDVQVYNILPEKVRRSIDAGKRIIYEKQNKR